jgi:hypothetical protein
LDIFEGKAMTAKTKVLGAGMTAPPPPPPPVPHISDAVREALPKLGPEKAQRVLDVADRK